MTLKFTVETTEDEIRDATPEEIVAWHVLRIHELCIDDNIVCNKCPLNLLRVDDTYSCLINLRANNAKRLLEGKKIIVAEVGE